MMTETGSLVLLAGEIMLKNGAETSRVEETMRRMGKALGAASVDSFVIPTGVFVTLVSHNNESITLLRRVAARTINLDRIDKVNELSHRLVDNRIGSESVQPLLLRIARERTGFSLLPSMMASGIVGGGFAVLQHGAFLDVVAAFVAAFLVRLLAHLVSRFHGVTFTHEFLGAVLAAAIGLFCSSAWPGLHSDIMISGGIMPLVPGVAVTNGIRDVIAGDLLSGISRSLEAALTSGAVAMGVILVVAMAAE